MDTGVSGAGLYCPWSKPPVRLQNSPSPRREGPASAECRGCQHKGGARTGGHEVMALAEPPLLGAHAKGVEWFGVVVIVRRLLLSPSERTDRYLQLARGNRNH